MPEAACLQNTGGFARNWPLACGNFAAMFLMFLFGICFRLAACDATVNLSYNFKRAMDNTVMTTINTALTKEGKHSTEERKHNTDEGKHITDNGKHSTDE
jgi:hypothetical protein